MMAGLAGARGAPVGGSSTLADQFLLPAIAAVIVGGRPSPAGSACGVR